MNRRIVLVGGTALAVRAPGTAASKVEGPREWLRPVTDVEFMRWLDVQITRDGRLQRSWYEGHSRETAEIGFRDLALGRCTHRYGCWYDPNATDLERNQRAYRWYVHRAFGGLFYDPIPLLTRADYERACQELRGDSLT